MTKEILVTSTRFFHMVLRSRDVDSLASLNQQAVFSMKN
jgi:hypothetical protein